MKKTRSFGPIGLLLFACLIHSAPADRVDGERILEHIRVLAGDAMEGRRSGMPGADRAAEHIAARLKAWGLEPAGVDGTYFQKFPLKNYFTVNPGCRLVIENSGEKREFRYNDEYFDEWRVCRMSGSGDVRAEIVFVGYGIHDPENGYDDYRDVEVSGKTAFLCAGYPGPLAAEHSQAAGLEARILAARNMGAAAVMLFPEAQPYGRETRHFPEGFSLDPEHFDPGFVIVGINPMAADYIFNYLSTDLPHELNEIKRQSEPRSFATGVMADLSVRTEFSPERETFNVLAKLPGTDDRLKTEYIILGAHMDGLGMTPRGDVLNGANDNASGTAVVMETARILKGRDFRPKRTILFALWAAEEQGLLGSKHYAAHPLYPLEQTVININLDMVGQGGGIVSLGGIYLSQEIWKQLEPKMDAEVMAGMNPRRGVGGSDHLAFLAKGVPAFHMVGTEPHFKTHHSRDEVDLIKVDMLEKAGRFLLQASMALADMDGDFFFPRRAEKVLFRHETIVNTRPIPLDTLVADHREAVNPDVGVQLAVLEADAGADPLRTVTDWIKKLSGLQETLRGSTGLTLFSGDWFRLMRGSRTAQVFVGLKGTDLFFDDPERLGIFAGRGVHYIIIEGRDPLVGNAGLTRKGRDFLRETAAAGLLPIFTGLDGESAKSLLAEAHKPALLVQSGVPSAELAEIVRRGGHVVGMIFSRDECAESYFRKLEQAVEVVGKDNIMIWNEEDLWNEAALEPYLDLMGWLMKEGWTEEIQFYLTPAGKIISRNFAERLMQYRPSR